MTCRKAAAHAADVPLAFLHGVVIDAWELFGAHSLVLGPYPIGTEDLLPFSKGKTHMQNQKKQKKNPLLILMNMSADGSVQMSVMNVLYWCVQVRVHESGLAPKDKILILHTEYCCNIV